MTRLLAVALLCALAAPAQVRVVCSLSPDATATLVTFVHERLPDVELRVESRDTSAVFAEALAGQPIGAELLVGVDAQALELFAADGELQRLGVAVPNDAMPFYVDPEGLYVVPWADAYVVAHVRGTDSGPAPVTLEDLAAPAQTDCLALPSPEAAPSLFIEWLLGRLRAGDPFEDVASLFVGIDARVRGWYVPASRALLELDTGMERGFAIATWSTVRAAGPRFDVDLLQPFTPLAGLGVALGARAASPDASRAVAAVLLEPELALRLARRHALLPGVGAVPTDPDLERLAELVASAAPVAPDRRFVREWFVHFEADVRGQGRYSDALRSWLDVAFLVLFAGAMVLIYRRSQMVDR